jgi:hypothetical protein
VTTIGPHIEMQWTLVASPTANIDIQIVQDTVATPRKKGRAHLPVDSRGYVEDHSRAQIGAAASGYEELIRR